ncbi:MAG: SPOR domain-containing protein [Lentimicrobium sp.]|nr:SPOR domain-containing protein [Lentimicrobium sp.]
MLIIPAAYAQKGNVEVIADDRIDLLVEKHKYLNRHQAVLNGWRVQIFFDAGALSKRKATDAQHRFTARYPGIEAYLSFKEPYYRVRVGDFRTRIEAEGFLQKIKGDYPNSFAVSEMIFPPPLVRDRARSSDE